MPGTPTKVGEPSRCCLRFGVATAILIGCQCIYTVPLGQVSNGRLVENVKCTWGSLLSGDPTRYGGLHDAVVGLFCGVQTGSNARCAHGLAAERHLELDPPLTTRTGARDELYKILG